MASGTDALRTQMNHVTRLIEERVPDSNERAFIMDSLNKFDGTVNSVKDVLSGLGDDFKFMLNNATATIDTIGMLIVAGGTFHYLATGSQRSKRAAFVATIIVVLLNYGTLIANINEFSKTNLYHIACRLFIYFHTVEQQAIGQRRDIPAHPDEALGGIHPQASIEVIDTGVQIITTLLACVTHAKTGIQVPIEVFKNLSNVTRVKGTIMDFVKSVGSVFEDVSIWLKDKGIISNSVRFLHSNRKALDDFIQMCYDIEVLNSEGKLYSNSETSDKIDFALKQGRELLDNWPRESRTESLASEIRSRIHKLDNFRSIVISNSSSLRGLRAEPPMFVLRGAAGMGKTVSQTQIIFECVSRTLPEHQRAAFESNPMDFFFCRFHEMGYWDGWPKTCRGCMFDDLNQNTDVEGNPDNELMNVIRAKSSFPMPLHMADLSSKGNNYFTADFIGATTNTKIFNDVKSIRCIDALYRRFDLDLMVVPTVSYREAGWETKGVWEWKMDKAKILANDPTGRIKPEYLLFYYYDRDTCSIDTSREPMDINGVIDKLIEIYRRNKAWFSAMKKEDLAFVHGDKDKDLSSWDPDDSDEQSLDSRMNSSDKNWETLFKTWQKINSNKKELATAVRNKRYASKRNGSSFDSIRPQSSSGETDMSMHSLDSPVDAYFDTMSEADNAFNYDQDDLYDLDKWESVDLRERPAFDDSYTNYRDSITGKASIDYAKLFSGPILKLLNQLREREESGHGFNDKQKHLIYYVLKETIVDGGELPHLDHLVALGMIPVFYQKRVIVALLSLDRDNDKFARELISCIHRDQRNGKLRAKSNLYYDGGDMCNMMDTSSWYDCFNSFMDGNINPMYQKLEDLCKFVGKLAMGTAVFYFLYKIGYALYDIFKSTFGFLFPDGEGETTKPQSADYNESSKHKGTKPRMTPRQLRALRPQASIPELKVFPQGFTGDTMGDQLVHKFSKTNLYSVDVENGSPDNWTRTGNIVFIKGRVALMCYHYISIWLASSAIDSSVLKNKVRIRGNNRNGLSKCFTTTIGAITSNCYGENLMESDLVLVQFPKDDVPCLHVDRTEYFITELDLQRLRLDSKYYYSLVMHQNNNTFIYQGESIIYPERINVDDTCIPGYSIARTFLYNVVTKEGDCGAPFFIMDSQRNTRRIAAMHVAGNESYGFGAIITQEMIKDALDERESPDDDYTESFDHLYDIVPQSSNGAIPERFEVYGVMGKKANGFFTNNINKTLLHDSYYQSKLAPAVIGPRNGVDPMTRSINKYSSNFKRFDLNLLKRVADEELQSLHVKGSEDRYGYVLDEWTAVYGSGTEEDFKSMPWQTSSGYPMNCPGEIDLKPLLWPPPKTREREDDPDHAFWRLVDLIREYLDKLSQGIRVIQPFTNFPKVETRPKHKVEQMSTRFIAATTLVLAVAHHMYFGGFEAWIKRHRIFNGIALGINVYSSEWSILVRHMASKCADEIIPLVGAGDYSGFDSSQCVDLQDTVLYLIIEWYSNFPSTRDEDQRLRTMMWNEVTNSFHIYKGVLYSWVGGLASGHRGTIIINCLIGKILNRYVFYLVLPDENYDLQVTPMVYGDDLLYNVTRIFRPYFNDTIISQELALLGFKYTNELKSDGFTDFRPITQVSFLKRGFRWEKTIGSWVAPLCMESILNIPMWVKDRDINGMKAQTNAQTAIKELSLYDSQTFMAWRAAIAKAFKIKYKRSLEYVYASGPRLSVLKIVTSRGITPIMKQEIVDSEV